MSIGTAAKEVIYLFDEIICKKYKGKKTILTTSHERESINDIIFHLVHLTYLPNISPKFLLLLFPKVDKYCQDFINKLRENKTEN